MILRNPKDGKEIETNLTEEQAGAVLKGQHSDFARSLYGQWVDGRRPLSPSQYYWFFKLAEDNRPREAKGIELATNLQEFISHVPTMQFKIQLAASEARHGGDGTTYGKVLLKTRPDCVTIHSAYRCAGKIIGNKFYPSRTAWPNLIAQIMLFADNPIAWMTSYGKATGYCCVCGRELTNEVSVKNGIGPICAERFGF